MRGTSLEYRQNEMDEAFHSTVAEDLSLVVQANATPTLDPEDQLVLNWWSDAIPRMLREEGRYHPSLLSIVIDNLGFNGPGQLLFPLLHRIRAPNHHFPTLELNHYNSMIEALARMHYFKEAWDMLVEAQEVCLSVLARHVRMATNTVILACISSHHRRANGPVDGRISIARPCAPFSPLSAAPIAPSTACIMPRFPSTSRILPRALMNSLAESLSRVVYRLWCEPFTNAALMSA